MLIFCMVDEAKKSGIRQENMTGSTGLITVSDSSAMIFSDLLDEASYYSEIADFDKFAFNEHVNNAKSYLKKGLISEKQFILFTQYVEGLIV